MMAHVVEIVPSITLIIPGGDSVSLDDLQSFVDQARALGVSRDKPLTTKLEAPYAFDQRDSSPGCFTIMATP